MTHILLLVLHCWHLNNNHKTSKRRNDLKEKKFKKLLSTNLFATLNFVKLIEMHDTLRLRCNNFWIVNYVLAICWRNFSEHQLDFQKLVLGLFILCYLSERKIFPQVLCKDIFYITNFSFRSFYECGDW